MMYRRILQQQPPRDRIAALQQQMSASSGFQAQPQPGPAGADKPRQMGGHERAGERQKRVQTDSPRSRDQH